MFGLVNVGFSLAPEGPVLLAPGVSPGNVKAIAQSPGGAKESIIKM